MKKTGKFLIVCVIVMVVAFAGCYFFKDDIVEIYEQEKTVATVKDSIYHTTNASVIECTSISYFTVSSKAENEREYIDRGVYIIDQEQELYQHLIYQDEQEIEYTYIIDYVNAIPSSLEGYSLYNQWFHSAFGIAVNAVDKDYNDVYVELKPDLWSCAYGRFDQEIISGRTDKVSFGKVLENVDIEEVGEEECNGERATHYRIQMDFSIEYHYGPGESLGDPLTWAQFLELYCFTDNLKEQFPEEYEAVIKMAEDYVSSCYDIWISEDGYLLKLQKDDSVEFYYMLMMGNEDGAANWFFEYGAPKIINEQIYKYNQDAKQIQLPTEYDDFR